jgi:hypothetical protein
MALEKRRGRCPSTLKGLAEMRARLAGEVQQRQGFLADAQKALDDCDRIILRLFPKEDPQSIHTLRYLKHFVNRRGALRKTMLAILREQAPTSLTTRQIVAHMEERLNLRFICKQDRRQWEASLRAALTDATALGWIERTQKGTFSRQPHIPTMWRWKSGVKSLEMLAAEMDAAGFAYEYVKAEPEDATA